MTKTRRATKQERLRAIARLLAQSRLNVGQAEALGRVGEVLAWRDVCSYLEDIAELIAEDGVYPVRGRLFGEPEYKF